MTVAPWDMSGSVIAVVGAGPGIGLASATVLAGAGAAIACVDANRAVAEASAAELAGLGVATSAHAADVRDRSQVRAAVAELLAEHGRLNGVLNVVGRTFVGRAAELGESDWSAQLDLNLSHHLLVAQESLAALTETRGSYAAIGSINGLNTSPHSIAYGVSKAGLISLMRTLALEHAPTGVRFNVIAPGIVRTARAIEMGRDTARYKERIPLGKLAECEDIGFAALYLLSTLGRHVTGQTIVVDGGSMVNYALPLSELS